MKSFHSVACLLGAWVASPALAQDSSVPPASPTATPAAVAAAAPTSDFTITGAVDVATQYRFRGISQSDNKPVIQGTITLTHKSGFYVSAWGSSASANDAVNIGGTEIDVYGGYSHALGKSGVVLDGGLYGYLYPGSRKAVGVSESYFELYGDVSKPFGPISAKAGINWAPNQAYFRDFGTTSGYDIYVFGELGYAIPKTPISLHGHLGHTGGGFDYATHDYLDFAAGVSYKWKSLTFDVSAVGTKLSRADTRPFDVALGTNDFRRAAKTVAVGTVTASF